MEILKCVTRGSFTNLSQGFRDKGHLYCPACFKRKVKNESNGDLWKAFQKIWEAS